MWMPVDKVCVAPLIEHPPGAIILLSKGNNDQPAGIAVRFDWKVGEDTQRFLFYPGGLPWAQGESKGWALRLEDWRDRDALVPAYVDQTETKARVEISAEMKDANYVDDWNTQTKGRAFISHQGVRIFSGNGDRFNGNSYAIDPITWQADVAQNGGRIAWSDAWRLVFGDATNPTILFEHTVPFAQISS
jgi:hypothetical protein